MAMFTKPLSTNTRSWSDLDLDFVAHPVTKDIVLKRDVEAVKRSVRNLILTNPYEKPFHPEIASHVRDLLFEPFTPITATLVRNRIETVLENYEPRVSVTSVDIVDPQFQHMDNNSLNISINFTLRNDPNIQSVDILLERIR